MGIGGGRGTISAARRDLGDSVSTQATYLRVLDQFAEIGSGIELAPDLLAAAADARREIERFRVLIPLVGAFNAGKTSLVNAYLRRQPGRGLPTDIVPQTALATEIHAAASAEAECVELMGENDTVLREVDLEEFGQVEKQALKEAASEAQYAKAHLHDAALPDTSRKVLVDMPGLDSGIKTHNVAIQRYLPLGAYFIMVVDAEHGTLRHSEIEQLREFLAQEVGFTVLVNKIDKKKPDADAILSHIRDLAQTTFDKAVSVHAVSAAAGEVAPFKEALAGVDFDHALRGYWRTRLARLVDEAISSLHTRYSALNLSTAESDRVIADLEDKEEALKEKLRSDQRDIKNRYSSRSVDRIVRAVRDAVVDAALRLAEICLHGGKEAVEREVNELVRHTLNRTVAEERDDTMQRIAANYGADIDGLYTTFERFGDSAESSAELPQNMGTVLADAAGRSHDALRRAPSTIKTGSFLTTATGVLAVVTTVVGPWLDALFVLLPSLFRFLFGDSAPSREAQEQERREKLTMQIRSSVASSVASELRPQIAADYAEIAQQMLSTVGQEVEAKVGRIRADINKSQAEVEAKRQDMQARREGLQAAVEQLTAIKKSELEDGVPPSQGDRP